MRNMDYFKRRNEKNAFEIRYYKSIEKINWADRITNEEVLERVSERKSIRKNIQKRQSELIGRTLRHKGSLGLILKGTNNRWKKL